jgi:hypothetical protein
MQRCLFECVGFGNLSSIRWSRTLRWLQNVEKAVFSDILSDIQRDALKKKCSIEYPALLGSGAPSGSKFPHKQEAVPLTLPCRNIFKGRLCQCCD